MNIKQNYYKGKNILITGATRGIGKSITLELSKLGANVIMLSKNEAALDLIYDEIKDKYKTEPMILKCDLNDLDESKAQEIANVISENYGSLSALINNAATLGKMSSIQDYDLKSWEKTLSTNLTSAFLLSKYMIPLLSNSKIPRLIFTSTSVAQKGKAYWGAYSVSKAGLKALSEILKEELETIPELKVFNLASSKEVHDTFVEIEEMLLRVGYLLKHTSKAKISKFKNFILRANTSMHEINVLRGIVHQTTWF